MFFSGRDFAVAAKDAPLIAAAEVIDHALWRKLSAKGRKAVLALVAAGGYQLLDPQAEDEYEEQFDNDLALQAGHGDELHDEDDADGPELEVQILELVADPDSDEHDLQDEDEHAPELEIEYTELDGSGNH